MNRSFALFFAAALLATGCALERDEPPDDSDLSSMAQELPKEGSITCWGTCISSGGVGDIVYAYDTFFCETGNQWSACDGGYAYCVISWCE
jgi:hypothetical protein